MKIPVIDIKKYGGKQVALVRGKVVASGQTTREVLKRAKQRVPAREHGDIWIFAVPKTLTFVYRIDIDLR